MLSFSGFASTGLIIKTVFNETKTTTTFEKDSKVVVFENNNKESEDCKDRGGVCLVTIYTNGSPRSFERCCNDIVVVKRPTVISAE